MLSFWASCWNYWDKLIRQSRPSRQLSLAETYEVFSSASVEQLWGKVMNLADMSWHPLLAKTNVPYGLIPKPGLIFQAVSRLSPIPIKIFVERVSPGELLSVRVLAIPGLEERVTYRIESTVCGTCVSYSVTLKGWLSPLIWSITQPYAAKVARELALAAEQERFELPSAKLRQRPSLDWLGGIILMVSLTEILGMASRISLS
jgi:hypothetical protein